MSKYLKEKKKNLKKGLSTVYLKKMPPEDMGWEREKGLVGMIGFHR